MMKPYLFPVILFFLISTLMGCASITQKTNVPSTNNVTIDKTQLSTSLDTWDLSALIAIRNMNANHAETVNLNWQQNKQVYTMALFGPLGANAVKISGSPGHVLLEKGNGEKYTATSPEAMLAQQTGWRLPVSSLYYWIRGLPVPNIPSQKSMDDKNHIALLLQQGWRIQYLNYTPVRQIDLPTKLFLNNAELNIKIIISQWQF